MLIDSVKLSSIDWHSNPISYTLLKFAKQGIHIKWSDSESTRRLYTYLESSSSDSSSSASCSSLTGDDDRKAVELMVFLLSAAVDDNFGDRPSGAAALLIPRSSSATRAASASCLVAFSSAIAASHSLTLDDIGCRVNVSEGDWTCAKSGG